MITGLALRIEDFSTPYQWSQKADKLYFTIIPHSFSFDFTFFLTGEGLFTLDLGTGAIERILPHERFSFALSPDEETLAYIPSFYGELTLTVREFG